MIAPAPCRTTGRWRGRFFWGHVSGGCWCSGSPAIELFFRWVKQTLKIRHFLGNSENAVRIQIAIALIAFLLRRMAQTAQKVVGSPLAFARLVRANLMHRKRIDRLIGADPRPRIDPNQTVLQWA